MHIVGPAKLNLQMSVHEMHWFIKNNVEFMCEQAGVGQGAEVLGPGDADIESVCSGVEALLRHGLRPANSREGWTQYLPGRRSTPMDMLQVGITDSPDRHMMNICSSKLLLKPRVLTDHGWLYVV